MVADLLLALELLPPPKNERSYYKGTVCKFYKSFIISNTGILDQNSDLCFHFDPSKDVFAELLNCLE